jgi:predicted ArsR family transcriptional regulator
MAEPQPPRVPAGRRAVLILIKREGPIAAEALAARLGLTSMAVRQHLHGLAGEGLVEAITSTAPGTAPGEDAAPATRGRPPRLWQALPATDARFADAHADLTVELLRQLQCAFGQEGLDRILALRTRDQARAYAPEIDRQASLRGRLQALAAIREREGYMAEVRDDPEGDGFLLLEHHCPICAAARVCQGLCREELALFSGVLGPGAMVERVSHIIAGAGRCAYRVREV